jgi:hypothetical protein
VGRRETLLNGLGCFQATGTPDIRPVVPGKNREYDVVRDEGSAIVGRDGQIRGARTACREVIVGLAGRQSAESAHRSLTGLPSY